MNAETLASLSRWLRTLDVDIAQMSPSRIANWCRERDGLRQQILADPDGAIVVDHLRSLYERIATLHDEKAEIERQGLALQATYRAISTLLDCADTAAALCDAIHQLQTCNDILTRKLDAIEGEHVSSVTASRRPTGHAVVAFKGDIDDALKLLHEGIDSLIRTKYRL